MTDLYPEIEPYDQGMLSVGDDNLVYYETCGNPRGKPAVVFHGGPGSGCTPWWRRLFDPRAYHLVLFDQRGCGRSKPHASFPETDLTTNNTNNLIADIELLRKHLNVDQWLVFGGSWGSTLSLAYAEAHPDRVTEMILFGVTTGRRKEFDWLFRGGVATFFPAQWNRLRSFLPSSERDSDIVEAYSRLLNNAEPRIRQQAAHAWCMWESATSEWPPTNKIQDRFTNPSFAMAYARLVTHYVRHNAWLEDGILLDHADLVADIPGILLNGRFDFQSPIANAWELKQAWPSTELVIIEESGHNPNANFIRALVQATNNFASPH